MPESIPGPADCLLALRRLEARLDALQALAASPPVRPLQAAAEAAMAAWRPSVGWWCRLPPTSSGPSGAPESGAVLPDRNLETVAKQGC